jgi:8-oxo-dGTP pyrophosphatase MutT (NUDIX family)
MNRAAVVLILNSLEEEISLLLVRRAVRQDDPWSGQMAFPGGYMAAQDISVLDTAIREAREEVGINLLDHELIGTINNVRSARRPLIVTPFVALLRNKVVLTLQKNEVAEATWAPIRDLLRIPLIKRRIKTSEGELEVDGMKYRDQIIWGLTLRMIKDFLSRLDDGMDAPRNL